MDTTGKTLIQRHTYILTLFFTLLIMACNGGARQSIQQNEQVADATREIGEAYMRQGDYTAALRELLKAQKLDPEDPYVYNDLGLCYMAKRRMPEAIAHFSKALDLKPSYAPARNNLGSAYLEVESWDAAIDTFKEITKDALYATPHFPLSNLGLAYFHKGDYAKSLQYFKEALTLQPDFLYALRGAGRTYLAMNQGGLAVRYLEQAARQAPKMADIQFDLAEAYLLVGRAKDARYAYETVIDLTSPESPLAAKSRQRLSGVR